MKGFKSLRINNVHKFKESDVKSKNFWKQRCRDIKRGIYIYWLSNKKIPYPFKNSPIFYIGKAENIVNRLHWHFTVDNKIPLIENEKARSWTYQNYYIAKCPFNITLFSIDLNYLEKLEQLFIGVFVLKYGTAPICNAKIGREKLKRIYKSFSKSIRNKIEDSFKKL